jgi:hypothetical protein
VRESGEGGRRARCQVEGGKEQEESERARVEESERARVEESERRGERESERRGERESESGVIMEESRSGEWRRVERYIPSCLKDKHC